MLEPSAADAVREVAAHPEWLRLEGQHRRRARRRARRWARSDRCSGGAPPSPRSTCRRPRSGSGSLGTAPAAAGRRLLVPVAPGTEDAGVDLLAEVPATADWLRGPGRPARGRQLPLRRRRHPRPRLRRRRRARLPRDGGRPDTAVAFLATPTDVFAVPHAAVEPSGPRLRRAARAPPSSSAARCAGSRGDDCCTGQYPPGADPGIADCLVPQQGPNYALAKRIQRWRASVDRAAGRQVSFHVAPSTRTRSVVKNRALAAAFAGAHRFGVEVFDPATSNTLMAALLVHDLVAGAAGSRATPGRTRRTPRCTAACGGRRTSRAVRSAWPRCWATPAPAARCC